MSKPIEQMSLAECLDLLRQKRFPMVMEDGKVYHGMFEHQDRMEIADRIAQLNRWISVDERWPETEDMRGGKVLVYSACGRYWKTIDGPQNN